MEEYNAAIRIKQFNIKFISYEFKFTKFCEGRGKY